MDAEQIARDITARACSTIIGNDDAGHLEKILPPLIRDAIADAERAALERAVIEEIAAERDRQVNSEGWTPEHDNSHKNGELAFAAAAYAAHAAIFRDAAKLGGNYTTKAPPPRWPWSTSWWKPTNERRDLIKAAALIVAEIERQDRRALIEQPTEPAKTVKDEPKTLKSFGYAPGGYWGRCSDCGSQGHDADKRAWRCKPCAEKMLADWEASQPAEPAGGE